MTFYCYIKGEISCQSDCQGLKGQDFRVFSKEALHNVYECWEKARKPSNMTPAGQWVINGSDEPCLRFAFTCKSVTKFKKNESFQKISLRFRQKVFGLMLLPPPFWEFQFSFILYLKPLAFDTIPHFLPSPPLPSRHLLCGGFGYFLELHYVCTLY